MTKTELLAALREDRVGWTTVAQTMIALQNAGDRLIDELWSQLSEVEQRTLVRHLNGVWRKTKNRNLEYTFAVLNRGIAILEKQKG